MHKQELLDRGKELMERFCRVNKIRPPDLKPEKIQFRSCAYYRPQYIKIDVLKCAFPGTAGQAWSWPGYSVDRTPYGVVQHELGHHVDWLLSEQKGSYFGNYSRDLRAKTKELPITSYALNDAEWFAEIFRLYVTNPGLLAALRPATHAELRAKLKPVVTADWLVVFRNNNAPLRYENAVRNKLRAAR